jgi:hypothetical protein
MCRPRSRRLGLSAFAIAFLAAMLFSVQPSLAIGISPGRIEMDFVPGQNSTYDIMIIGGSYESIDVSSRPSDTCSLADYIIPDRTELSLKPGEKAYLKVRVLLPADYPRPGVHYCSLVAEEVPQKGFSGVAAFSAVAMQVWIRVPYPERYLDGRLSVSNVNLSGTAHFDVLLQSMGLKDVTASGVITVTDSSGRTVATLQTGSVFIKSMESGTMQAAWDTKDMPAGRYYATAAVEYGAEKPISVGTGFKIGDILVKVINITYPSDMFPDQIIKLEALVDSYWNDRIEGSYLTMDVTKDGAQVGETRRSESFDLEPWESRTVPLYWDTTGLSEGAYVAEFTVHYSGKAEKGITTLTIKQRQNPYLFLLLVLAVAAAIAAAAFYAYRRRKRKSAGKGESKVESGKEPEKAKAGKEDKDDGVAEKEGTRGKGGAAAHDAEKKTK